MVYWISLIGHPTLNKGPPSGKEKLIRTQSPSKSLPFLPLQFLKLLSMVHLNILLSSIALNIAT